jgi:electron transport complex protein RnfD
MREQDNLLLVTSSPHLKSPVSVPTAMRDVIIALIPAVIASLYFFRLQAALIIITSVVSAIVIEYVCLRLMNRERTVNDYSAAVTGLLLALTLPPTLPLWMVVIGAAVAIIIAKQFFGGLGSNVFNPALIGRAFLTASFPAAMTNWVTPLDAVSTATPLGILKGAGQAILSWDMFIGNIGGSLGETSALALLIGGIYLIYKRHIDWRIPGGYIGTVFVIASAIGLATGRGIGFGLFNVLAGGLFLGAFYMATDWVTSPITKKGRLIFGVGCGLLTLLIRFQGGYPEGVCYSILLMNILTPLIDRSTKARVFGGGEASCVVLSSSEYSS